MSQWLRDGKAVPYWQPAADAEEAFLTIRNVDLDATGVCVRVGAVDAALAYSCSNHLD